MGFARRAIGADVWDDVWAEYDARQPATPTSIAQATTRRPRRLPWRAGLFAATLATAAALTTPFAAAVQIAQAVQLRDAPALASQVDWAALRSGLEEALQREASTNATAPMPAFITTMASDMAGRLASPEGFSALLAERVASHGAASAHHLVRDIVPEGLDRWRLTLAASGEGRRAATLTLALAGPARWQVIGLGL